MKRNIFDEDHEALREVAREFAQKDVVPNLEAWAKAGIIDKGMFRKAGAQGLLGMTVPSEYGGGGMDDFRFSVVVNEELARYCGNAIAMAISGYNDLCAPYFEEFASPEQKQRWLPGLCSGELVSAIAMTEPGAGSDLAGIRTTARWDGEHYVLKGAKTFISNGINADLIVTVVKTDPDAGRKGVSLLVVEGGMAGFERGSSIKKVGLHAQDTAELFFDNVKVPKENLLGQEGAGFGYLMHNLVRERLSIAVAAMTSMEVALDEAVTYTKNRMAFGQRVADFQTTRHRLAEMATRVEVARVFLDRCIQEYVAGTVSEIEGAMAKWYVTELQQQIIADSLQLHGGYGFVTEYPIAREYLDARVTTLFGGTTEIMKEIIGRSLTK